MCVHRKYGRTANFLAFPFSSKPMFSLPWLLSCHIMEPTVLFSLRFLDSSHTKAIIFVWSWRGKCFNFVEFCNIAACCMMDFSSRIVRSWRGKCFNFVEFCNIAACCMMDFSSRIMHGNWKMKVYKTCKELKGHWTTSASSPSFFSKKLRFLYH